MSDIIRVDESFDFKTEMQKMAEVQEKEDEKKVIKILSGRSLSGKCLTICSKDDALLVKRVMERHYRTKICMYDFLRKDGVLNSVSYQLEFPKSIYEIINPLSKEEKKEIPFANVIVEHNGGDKSLCEKEDLTP